ncbi:nucleotidyltransferase family protein [Sphingomonas sp. CGMCC 1.13654]|uniref:Nucleotidyltransferase family protein n=1 Tax=Sphingomonas chungangi TaxID=2683589 RepID=A0A838L8X8_9SPHN|nr:nucleotidyltransferase family protein [Sphingomonas chungangi]MBA2935903.1 nucleotidyltransferase family protein [Sphingomonas chungangi]MVW54594.1 NTP transferase domain-containing protein [Sphingomonas chungangi]
MKIAAVLLAAGRSERFADGDKLAAPLGGLSLGLHAARTLAALPLSGHIVVTGPRGMAWPDVTVVPNDRRDAGMARSIALGVAAARRTDIDAVLIALADMPFVSVEHLERLIACYRGPDTLVASSDGVIRMPPALFGAAWFDTLETLSGDRGARAMLEQAEIVLADPAELHDVDRVADLEAARGRFQG